MSTSDGTNKPWRDMTPAERQREHLRHLPTLLARWRGARAKMWELTISHKTLTIRLERPGSHDNLHVSCYPIHIHGPVAWSNCDLTVSLTDAGKWVIKDAIAGLEILAEGVEVRENCKPIYEAG
jgi:hypothetical protein